MEKRKIVCPAAICFIIVKSHDFSEVGKDKTGKEKLPSSNSFSVLLIASVYEGILEFLWCPWLGEKHSLSKLGPVFVFFLLKVFNGYSSHSRERLVANALSCIKKTLLADL